MIFGGEIVPAAMAVMFMDAWRLALMSMELDPLVNRFPWPVKLIGYTIESFRD